ncbi:aryl-alcohol-oxidase from pleurotus Eryingii [Collybia nuda]|uniref:Aryl-alcohol-oxidase from pleurotus Eryingii n=1 Tax=Collybia nuda TaxID=64659 RepID=A0A9P6CFQ0_9AGAR|nr:aryl-alcohol-oxidase from pleurotus Eryingii [Collybia nuda]
MLLVLAGFFSILTLLTTRATATLYSNAEDLPSLAGFDYIIVGGGTAGCVLANRLTEDANVRVLLLEAGPSNRNVLDLMVPAFSSKATPNTPWDWNFTTIVQSGINNRTFPYQQGHVLGGSSSVNSMLYTRASAEDYDRLSRVAEDSGWSWEKVVPYFKKNEIFVAPADGHQTNGQYDPAVHGLHGVNGVSLAGFSFSVDALVTQAMSELHDEFPFVLDYNSGKPLGMDEGWSQSTIRNGARSSAATSYLADSYLKRANLHVLIHAHVLRVSPETTGGKIDKVTFTQLGRKKTIDVKASREVILCAGTINTPHILINSGIGDASALKVLNITLVKDLPSVGRNLSDHAALIGSWDRNATDTLAHWTTNTTGAAEALAQWTDNQTGPFANGLTNQVGFLRLNESSPDVQAIFEMYGDLAPGPSAPHIQLFPFNSGPFSLSVVLLTPHSRGSVQLNPADPPGPPLVDIGFYTSPADVLLMRQAVLKMLRFASAPVWKQNLGVPLGGIADIINSDVGAGIDMSVVDAYARATTFTVNHAAGTTAMSPRGAAWGVVDPDLRVKGVKGLRVVGASVFPFIPTANLQAPVYAVAERASDIIKSSY